MIRLATFGGLALSNDGVPMTGAAAQRSRLAVLALLASAGSAGMSRDKLLLYLWAESDSERARHRLKQAVYALRRDLDNDDAITGTATLCLNPAVVETDLRDFESAVAAGDDAAAVAAYAGPFLDGVFLKDAPEFERWTADQRTRLAHDWCSAVERLAAGAEADGQWREAIARRRQLATAEPLGGRVTMALMRALAEGGDVAGALQHYRIHEAMVRDELEAAPESEVSALADAMRSGSWQRSVRPVYSVPPSVPVEIRAPISMPKPSPLNAVDPVVSTVPTTAAAPVVERPRSRYRRIVAVFAAGLLVVAAAAFASVPKQKRTALLTYLTSARPQITPGLYVVAPLENRTGDTTLNMFGDLAAETVIEALHRANMEVVPAMTAVQTNMILGSMPSVVRPHEIGLAVAREHGASTAVIGSYYKDGSVMRVSLRFIDMTTGKEGTGFPPIEGVVNGTTGVMPLAEKLGRATLARVAQITDTTAEGITVSLVPASSYEAYADVSRAYGHFFQDPTDTVGLFALLNRARVLDPDYTAPLLIRGYVLDVKRVWPGVDETVRQLRPYEPRLNAVERGWVQLFDADLHGAPYERLRAANQIMRASPKSTEIALVVVLSALYVGKTQDALAALATADPNHGINLVSPIYWQWRAQVEHEAERYDAERKSADEGMKRFEWASASVQTKARVLATAGAPSLADLHRLLSTGVPNDSNPRDGRLDLMVTAARELRHHGSPAAADSIFRQVVAELTPPSPSTSRFERHLRASVLYDLGQYEEARSILVTLAQDSTDLVAKGRLGAIAVRLNDKQTAARIDAELGAVTVPYAVGTALAWRAHMAAAGGHTAEAVTLLGSAVRHGYRLLDLSPDTVHLDRDFVELSKSPPYRQLLQELANAVVP